MAQQKANVREYNKNAGGIREVLEIGGGIDLKPEHFRVRTTESSPGLDALKRAIRATEFDGKAIFEGEEWVRSGQYAGGSRPTSEQLRHIAWQVERHSEKEGTRVFAHASGGCKSWLRMQVGPRSWHTLTRVSPEEFRETLYDDAKGVFRAAVFRGGHAANSRQARFERPDRIVFSPLRAHGLMAPSDPPAWWSAVVP